ncbi:unnamed protein product [Sphenostylis stenocarpa]|uniref:Uncharacterized protein n=1 Tax=Sphenostylis stenocarpa TaxID=92480 RepID=A0AA86VKQ6_9FABA|nr:unnamed protein product [Sphenostylis stenocarpa]
MIDKPKGCFTEALGHMTMIFLAVVMARDRKDSNMMHLFLHNVDWKCGAITLSDSERVHIVTCNMDERSHIKSLIEENLQRQDAAEIAPVVAVRGLQSGGVVVADKVGPVRQHDVVFGEAFLHRRIRRNNDNETGTEPKREDLAVFLRDKMERTVERLFELMEVSEYRVRKWSWRKIPESSCLEQQLQGKDKKHKYQGEIK